MGKTDNTVLLPGSGSVDEFLARAEPAGRREDGYTLRAIMDRVTAEQPVLWGPSIVGYGSFHYRYASGREGDMPIIGFSPRKASMSVYGIQFAGGEEMLAAVGPLKRGAGCVWLGRLSAVDLNVLESLIAEAWRRGTP